MPPNGGIFERRLIMDIGDIFAASARNSALSEQYAQNARGWSAEQAAA